MSNVFGNLRSLLQRPAHDALWHELCTMLDAQAARVDESQWQEIVAYTRGVLRHWPAQMCLAPERWVDAMFEGIRVPQIAVARAIDTRGRDVGDEQIFELTITPELSELSSLSMGYARRVAWRPERLDYACVRELCTCPHLSGLRTLRLMGQHLLPDSFASILTRSNTFSCLEALDFSFNDLNFLKPGDLDRLSFHPIKHLHLRSSNLSSQGIQVLEALTLLHGLETLDLSDNRHLTTPDLIHLLGYDSKVFANLRALHLSTLNVEPGQLVELFMATSPAKLDHLDLSGCTFQANRDVGEIMGTLACASLSTLRSVNLSDVGMGEASTRELEQMWPAQLEALERISLQRNNMGAAHVDWLSARIIHGARWLDLSGNTFEPEHILSMISRLARTPPSAPCTLVLDDNHIDPAGEDMAKLHELAESCEVTLELTRFMPHITFAQEQELYDDVWEG